MWRYECCAMHLPKKEVKVFMFLIITIVLQNIVIKLYVYIARYSDVFKCRLLVSAALGCLYVFKSDQIFR